MFPKSNKEAKSLGVNRYFTGVPCKNGHICERISPSGNCLECFSLYSQPYGEAYYQNNKEKIKHKSDKRYKEKKDHVLSVQKANPGRKEYNRQWAINNRDYLLEYYKQWRSENHELCLAYGREWQRNNREKTRESVKKWTKNNPEKVKVLCSIRRNAEGFHTADDLKRIYRLQGRKCAYCREELNDAYQVDHIIAIVNGGTNWPRNIQLLCYKKVDGCNQKKGAKDPIKFAQSLGLLL